MTSIPPKDSDIPIQFPNRFLQRVTLNGEKGKYRGPSLQRSFTADFVCCCDWSAGTRSTVRQTMTAVPIDAAKTRKKKQTPFQIALPFLLGGAAGSFSTCIIQPIDMVKVRLQLSGELGSGATVRSPLAMAKSIYATEGMTHARHCTDRLPD